MNKTKSILLEEKFVSEYIEDIVNDFKIKTSSVKDYKYHHNTSYSDATSIIRNGILSIRELTRLGIKNYSNNLLDVMSDTSSHVNGADAISLAVVGLDDLYREEFEYDPYSPTNVDFLISGDILTYRNTINYGNEYLSFSSINPDKFRAVDVRLLKYLEIEKRERKIINNDKYIPLLLEKYNQLRDIALALKEKKLDIPFREMSYDKEISLDIERVSELPKIMLKK